MPHARRRPPRACARKAVRRRLPRRSRPVFVLLSCPATRTVPQAELHRATVMSPPRRRSSMGQTMRNVMALALSLVGATTIFAQGGGQGGGARAGGGGGARGPQQPMSFFITSVGKGDGANYGGLAGADAWCQQLAAAAGRGDGVT